MDHLFASKSFCAISAAAWYVALSRSPRIRRPRGCCARGHRRRRAQAPASRPSLVSPGLPSTPGFRRLRDLVLVGTVKVHAETAIGFLAFEPNFGQVLPDEVARGDAPSLELS